MYKVGKIRVLFRRFANTTSLDAQLVGGVFESVLGCHLCLEGEFPS